MMNLRPPLNAGLLLIALCGAACAEKPTAAQDWDATFVALGETIVAENCVACHATERNGDSPRADAPPLRTVLTDFNPEALAEDFREHIHVGHADMPDFNFNVKETEAVLAYLRSIQE